jgi:hypothetical protein
MLGGDTDTLEAEEVAKCIGIIPRVAANLFEQIKNSGKDYRVRISACQIYNETISDLLRRQDALSLVSAKSRQKTQSAHSKGHPPKDEEMSVAGLSWFECNSPAFLLSVLRTARRNLIYAETALNRASSRSHAVFTLEVLRSDGAIGKLTIIDLAGSEQYLPTSETALGESSHSVTSTSGAVATSNLSSVADTSHAAINSSLLALGRVVRALATHEKHIPYRSSVLTHLLKGRLGGSNITAVVANVRPTLEGDGTNSRHTLNFAASARSVVVHALQHRLTQRAQAKQLDGALVSILAPGSSPSPTSATTTTTGTADLPSPTRVEHAATQTEDVESAPQLEQVYHAAENAEAVPAAAPVAAVGTVKREEFATETQPWWLELERRCLSAEGQSLRFTQALKMIVASIANSLQVHDIPEASAMIEEAMATILETLLAPGPPESGESGENANAGSGETQSEISPMAVSQLSAALLAQVDAAQMSIEQASYAHQQAWAEHMAQLTARLDSKQTELEMLQDEKRGLEQALQQQKDATISIQAQAEQYSRGVSELQEIAVLDKLQQGFYVLKHNPKGKPHSRYIRWIDAGLDGKTMVEWGKKWQQEPFSRRMVVHSVCIGPHGSTGQRAIVKGFAPACMVTLLSANVQLDDSRSNSSKGRDSNKEKEKQKQKGKGKQEQLKSELVVQFQNEKDAAHFATQVQISLQRSVGQSWAAMSVSSSRVSSQLQVQLPGQSGSLSGLHRYDQDSAEPEFPSNFEEPALFEDGWNQAWMDASMALTTRSSYTRYSDDANSESIGQDASVVVDESDDDDVLLQSLSTLGDVGQGVASVDTSTEWMDDQHDEHVFARDSWNTNTVQIPIQNDSAAKNGENGNDGEDSVMYTSLSSPMLPDRVQDAHGQQLDTSQSSVVHVDLADRAADNDDIVLQWDDDDDGVMYGSTRDLFAGADSE